MKIKFKIKIVVDIAMIAALLFLMSYELIGQEAHEWIGIGMFALFILHHILNWKWSRNILKGNYTAPRFAQTCLNVLIFAAMIGSMYSGMLLSNYALSFIPISLGYSFARNLHMISAYWGLVFMSLHLGFHWNMMIGMARKVIKKPSAARFWIGRAIALLLACYGVRCFIKRQIGSYMFLKIPFVFFDFNEPIIFFFLDYIAIMCLFVFLGHYSFTALIKIRKHKALH